MIKKNKWQLTISLAVILLTILVGVILWDFLPDKLAIHCGTDGQYNGWNNKQLAVFLPSAVILLIHWLCALVSAVDPKNKKQSSKAFRMTFWINTILLVFSCGLIYVTALGMEFSVSVLMTMALGFSFMLIGNYLSKCKRNYAIGIRGSGALNNEENWNATHRFCGKVWMVGGFPPVVCSFIQVEAMPTILTL